MIQFSVVQSGKQYLGFKCEGHAGWGEAGEDIVCAAVSALTVNMINSVEMLTEDAYEAGQAEDGGYVDFRFTEEPSEAGRILISSLILGMQSIQEEYGEDFISVEFIDQE